MIVKKFHQKICDFLLPCLSKKIDLSNEEEVKKAIKRVFFVKMGRRIDLSDPKTFNEKIQLYKLYLNDKGYEKYVDKISVSFWVSSIIGTSHLIPVYKVWNSVNEIDFTSLPNSFMLKCNNGSGMNYTVKNKEKESIDRIRKMAAGWLSTNFAYQNGYELQYKGVVPKIYAEELLDANMLREYKFLCFNGKPYYCICDFDRFGDHRRNIYDMNWDLQPWNTGGFHNTDSAISTPSLFREMKGIASDICSGFSHVRVDLYDYCNSIYFNELTFTSGSGYSSIIPKRYDFDLGQLWNFPKD